MAQSPKIKSDDFNIEELFKDFYSVPDFQREYVWQKENVEKLLDDVFEALYENDLPLKDAEYFLGSIVVYKDEEDNFQLIDGQQRMTTIYLVFCVLRNLFSQLDEQFKIINQLITNSKIDRQTHNEVTRCHIVLQHDTDSEKVLKKVAENINYECNITKKRKGKILSSYDHINIAINTIYNWLNNKLP